MDDVSADRLHQEGRPRRILNRAGRVQGEQGLDFGLGRGTVGEIVTAQTQHIAQLDDPAGLNLPEDETLAIEHDATPSQTAHEVDGTHTMARLRRI